MTESLEIAFDITYSSGEACDYCGKKIEDLNLVRFNLPAKPEPYNMHADCLEKWGWNINYFTFHFTVSQKVPSGVN